MGLKLDLGVLITLAVISGQFLGSMAERYFLSSDTKHEADVKLIELAIGILGKPLDDHASSTMHSIDTSQGALRSWAVEVINEASSVKFDNEAKMLLVTGSVSLPNWFETNTFEKKELIKYLERYERALRDLESNYKTFEELETPPASAP